MVLGPTSLTFSLEAFLAVNIENLQLKTIQKALKQYAENTNLQLKNIQNIFREHQLAVKKHSKNTQTEYVLNVF